jgi:hypothetical protein
MSQPTEPTQTLISQLSNLSLSDSQTEPTNINLKTLIVEILDRDPTKQLNALVQVRKLLSTGTPDYMF